MMNRSKPHSLVVIGAGAAGIYLARKLAESGELLLIESGPRNHFYRCDSRNEIKSFGPYLNGQKGRARGLGGTTNLWGGQLLPFSFHDLVPQKGWPLTLEELQPHFEAVSQLLIGESCDYGAAAAMRAGWPLPRLQNKDFVLHISKWLANPRFRQTLGRSLPGNVRLIANLTIDGIEALESGGYRLHATDAAGLSQKIEAEQVVLATGTIEAIRLLLVSKENHGLPVTDAIGKGFMDHVSVNLCIVKPSNRWHLHRWFNTRRGPKGTRYSVRMSASSQLLKDDKQLNSSTMLLVRSPRKIWQRLANALAALYSYSVFGFVFKPYGDQVINVMVEQSADLPTRFVKLMPDGMPGIAWSPVQAEAEAALLMGRRVGDALWLEGWLRERPVFPPVHTVQRALVDVCHPMGGAAMHEDPDRRVVSRDLEVINCPGLWIASAAVFPSGSHSNPTFTLLALVDRLACKLVGLIWPARDHSFRL